VDTEEATPIFECKLSYVPYEQEHQLSQTD